MKKIQNFAAEYIILTFKYKLSFFLFQQCKYLSHMYLITMESDIKKQQQSSKWLENMDEFIFTFHFEA